jgi:general secretion pathway protein J
MNRREQGFTLVEILVAVSISSIMLVTIYGVFTSMSNARIKVETEGEGFHQARVIFDRIGREIRSSFVHTQAQASQLHRLQGGIDDRGLPYLALATTAGSPRQGGTGGVALIRYELRQDAAETDGKASLFRSETPDFLEDELPTTYRMARDIETFRLRFLHDGEWQDEWPTASVNLSPQAVEVTLSLLINGTSVPFRSTFEVPDIGAN